MSQEVTIAEFRALEKRVARLEKFKRETDAGWASLMKEFPIRESGSLPSPVDSALDSGANVVNLPWLPLAASSPFKSLKQLIAKLRSLL